MMSNGGAQQMDRGRQAPEFCAKDREGMEHCLKEYRGKWVVLYFYPKDNTPGCTIEAVDFTALKAEFERLGATIIGVSPDSERSHQGFTEKHQLSVILLSDPERSILKAYGAWQDKYLYGRSFLGVVRSTVLIDPEGKIVHHWPNVSAKGHAQEVLDLLAKLRAK